MAVCVRECGDRAFMKRPKTGEPLCKECFYSAFEDEVHETIVKYRLFKPGEFVAVAASGGKDSTVLAYMMKLLNQRHNYGLKLVLLSVDEGITGYRDDSLETVKRNEQQYGIPLNIFSYKDLYGWTMDDIVREVGRKNNCTFCGVFRRQALDRGALKMRVDKIVTGHNADDVAETILMNLLRGDVARLQRCTNITTGAEGALPRCKPFKYTYEKEIVLYAHYKKLDYFSTECIYSPNAYRGHVRTLIKDLERIRPSSIVDIIHSGESLSIREGVKMPTQGICTQCGYISSQGLCKACVMLEGLNKGLPRLGIGKSSKVNGSISILKTRNQVKSRPNCKSVTGTKDDSENATPDSGDLDIMDEFQGCGGSCECVEDPKTKSGGMTSCTDDDIKPADEDLDIETLTSLAKKLLTVN